MALIGYNSTVLLQKQNKKRAFNVIPSGLPLPLSLPLRCSCCCCCCYGNKNGNGNASGHCGVNFQTLHHHHYQLQSSFRIPRPSSSVHAQLQSFAPSSTSTNITATPGWSEFAGNVSGEWDGFGADFTNTGDPIQLPDSVVPQAFREWEVEVFDWQTQCPTLAALPPHPHPLAAFTYNSIKLLPTVGCEADAATRFSLDERNLGLESVDDHHNNNIKASAFAYQSSGSYVAVWQTGVPASTSTCAKLLELEHCLIHPQDRESRVRIIQIVRVANNSKMTLEGIRVFCEQWYGPFRNGDQLGGCPIRDSAFASTAAVDISQVAGVWNARVSAANFQNSQTGLLQELLDNGTHKSVRDECHLIPLPKQLWCSVKESKDDEPCYDFEVGWLYDNNGCALTSRCIFSSDSKLKEISLARETTADLESL